LQSQVTTIASDVVEVRSDTTAIESELILVHSETTALQTQTTTIASDLVEIYSDTTAIVVQATTIASDTALLETSRTEPGQGAPGVSVSMLTKIDYLYKAWRNKLTQTSTTYSLYDDAGTVVDQKATISDDGTTATKGEIVTGP